jgi:hypothetical protein
MTRMDDGTLVTDLDANADNAALLDDGYTIRHIETWTNHGTPESFILWEAPAITEADIPY